MSDTDARKQAIQKLVDEWMASKPSTDERRAVYWFLRFSGIGHKKTLKITPESDAYTKALMAMKFAELNLAGKL